VHLIFYSSGGVILNVLASSAVQRRFGLWFSRIKNIKLLLVHLAACPLSIARLSNKTKGGLTSLLYTHQT